MNLVVWATFAILLWIVLWALGVKALDASMLSILIFLVAATVEIVKNYLPNRGR